MLDIFTDNWNELPELNEDEHIYRIHTNNPSDNLYTITDLTGDELYDEVAFAIRRKHGKDVRVLDLEDVSCILYEDDASL